MPIITENTESVATESFCECPLCGGTSWKKLPQPGNWAATEEFADLQGAIGLVKCRDCKLVFTNPRPSIKRLSAFYSGDTYTAHEPTCSSAWVAKADFVFDRIAKHVPASTPRTLLDYGAGGGGFLSYARRRGWQVQGFEPGQRGAAFCREAGLDVTDKLDDLPPAAFGLVTLHHVLEHLANPIEALGSIHRLLAPHGRLYVEVPNAASLRARLAMPFLSRRFPIDDRYHSFPIHLMHYCDTTLRRILEKAGWTVETMFTVGIGLDDFFVRRDSRATRASRLQEHERAGNPRKRRWRHLLRDAFLDLRLGESLAAIAYRNVA